MWGHFMLNYKVRTLKKINKKLLINITQFYNMLNDENFKKINIHDLG